MKAKLENSALPESNLEEFNNPQYQYQADEAEYNEIRVDEDEDNV